ncbi:MAG: hypothetical protein HY260_19735 [Chloroflexi bacterium]|nr:hypothetical protein [Chloroflexota bacterium]
MTQVMTIEVPDHAVQSAAEIAHRSQRRVEEVLADWLEWAATELPIETLSDNEVLALCDLQMGEAEQEKLGDLLADSREGTLDADRRAQLDELMGMYRQGMIRKARALKVAVQRGLRPSLN